MRTSIRRCVDALAKVDMSELRPYQRESVTRVLSSSSRSVCLVEPTGAGKTHEAIVMSKALVAAGARPLFLARLDILLSDVYRRFLAAGVHTGIIQGNRQKEPEAPVQIGSLQTLHARGAVPDADVVFVDECHGAPAPMLKRLLMSYRDARVIGMTATPWRLDDAPLGDVFDEMIVGSTVRELVAIGQLVPSVVRVPHPDDSVLGGLIGHPVAAYEHWTPGSLAVVFARDVAHARQITADAAAKGIPAELMIGTTARGRRDEILERMQARTTRMLVGVGVFKEGFDAPYIETIILARGFASMAEYLQACGRGLRPSHGKSHCAILDLQGSTLACGGSPDDPRVWTLQGSGKVVDYSQQRAAHACRRCGLLHRGGSCPECATATVMGDVPPHVAAIERMVHYTGVRSEYLDGITLRHLIGYAKRRHFGSPREWALAQFERGVGYAPSQEVQGAVV